MEYDSARTGGLFAVLPQEILLREIISWLSIPETYSLRVAVDLGIPRKSLPALFVKWTFLPRVRYADREDHVVSSYDISWCLRAGICSMSPLVKWCLLCKPVADDINAGLIACNMSRGTSFSACTKKTRNVNVVTAMMPAIALLCGNQRRNVEKVGSENTTSACLAAVLCLGVNPRTKTEHVLQILFRSNRAFITDDALITTYALGIPGGNMYAVAYLAHLWRTRLPEDPRVYELLSAENVRGHVLRRRAEVNRVLEVLLSTCYLCKKCTHEQVVTFGERVFIEYLKHRAAKHPPHDLRQISRIPKSYKKAVMENVELLYNVYDSYCLVDALRNLIREDMDVWRAFRAVFPETVLTSGISLAPYIMHLFDPDHVTISQIMVRVTLGDLMYLHVVINYGPRGVQILSDPENARRVKRRCLSHRVVKMINAVTAARQ
jgi:hypothetical protein